MRKPLEVKAPSHLLSIILVVAEFAMGYSVVIYTR